MPLLDHLRDAFEKVGHEVGDGAREAGASVLESVRQGFEGVTGDLDAFVAELMASAPSRPREVFALLRALQPILVVRAFALVTRCDDVEEVFARDEVFDVPYAAKMALITNGENFFLGMRDTPRYTRDASNMRIAVRRDDLPGVVAPFVDRTAGAIVAAAAGAQLEVVKGLTLAVPARLVGTYFGTPGPSEEAMIEWTSVLFQFLFFDPMNDPSLRTRALAASTALNGYVDAAIAARKAAPRDVDDVLARCLSLQRAGVPGMTDLDIRNDFIGLLIGAIPTTGTATAFVIDELLKRPDALAQARAAAQAGDDATLAGYVFEAMRFNPMTPGIFRTSNREYTLAQGTSRAKTIPAGATVIAATQSAMFDAKRVQDPEAFRADRPSYTYLHFGYGLHQCFGRHVNAVQIPGIVKALLLRPNLRRAPGAAGQLTKDGPYAGSLTVAFD